MSARRIVVRRSQRGLTLLEVLVSIGILAMVSTLIYAAFDGMSRARKATGSQNERYHQGRLALTRISREVQAAFLSLHRPMIESQRVRETIFVGNDRRPIDRLDFTSFSYRRMKRDSHVSDQCEISYFGSRDPKNSRKVDLVRRVDSTIDLNPDRGGAVNVMAEDVERFDLSYLDPQTGNWVQQWDSTQATGQLNRLPYQVRVELVLKESDDYEGARFVTKVPVAINQALNFAGQIQVTP